MKISLSKSPPCPSSNLGALHTRHKHGMLCVYKRNASSMRDMRASHTHTINCKINMFHVCVTCIHSVVSCVVCRVSCVVSCRVMSCHVVSCHVVSCRVSCVVSCHVVSCRVVSCVVCRVSCVVFCSVLFCSVLFCSDMSCHVMSCHVMSCRMCTCTQVQIYTYTKSYEHFLIYQHVMKISVITITFSYKNYKMLLTFYVSAIILTV